MAIFGKGKGGQKIAPIPKVVKPAKASSGPVPLADGGAKKSWRPAFLQYEKNVKKSEPEKRAHAEGMLNYPKAVDQAMQDRLKQRKEQGGLNHRTDIKSFVDFIDADEKRI